MFKNLFKTDKNESKNESKLAAFANKAEALNAKKLTQVTGGDGGTTLPDPSDVAKVKSHSNQNNN